MSTTGSGPGRQAAERTDQGSRGTAAGGRSNGSAGTGAYNGQGRPNAVAAALAGPTGMRGLMGNVGPRTSAYYGGLSDYANNYTDDPGSRIVKGLTGIGLRKPNYDIPATYSHGLAHTNVDPLGIALGAAGMATGVPVGAIYGLGKQVTGWEGPQVKLGDASPGVPGPGQGFNYSGTGPQGRFGQGTGTPTGAPGLGNPTQGGGMGGLPNPAATIPGGAPFGPQPSAPSLGTPAPAFPGGVPNHTLPQGYQSMFPSSLTDQDKALLYAKALGGGMG